MKFSYLICSVSRTSSKSAISFLVPLFCFTHSALRLLSTRIFYFVVVPVKEAYFLIGIRSCSACGKEVPPTFFTACNAENRAFPENVVVKPLRRSCSGVSVVCYRFGLGRPDILDLCLNCSLEKPPCSFLISECVLLLSILSRKSSMFFLFVKLHLTRAIWSRLCVCRLLIIDELMPRLGAVKCLPE